MTGHERVFRLVPSLLYGGCARGAVGRTWNEKRGHPLKGPLSPIKRPSVKKIVIHSKKKVFLLRVSFT